MPSTPPLTPAALLIEEAMQRSEPLHRLRERLADSRARFDAIRGALPALLAAQVEAGPVDEAGWSLLAANTAVAAKLRHLQPRLEAVLAERGWSMATIRIKIRAG